jgi:hypothetical protein
MRTEDNKDNYKKYDTFNNRKIIEKYLDDSFMNEFFKSEDNFYLITVSNKKKTTVVFNINKKENFDELFAVLNKEMKKYKLQKIYL